MKKIFLVCPNIQPNEIEKYCYKKCKKILVGAIRLDDIGFEGLPCDEESCIYERASMELEGYDYCGKRIFVRKLISDGEDGN